MSGWHIQVDSTPNPCLQVIRRNLGQVLGQAIHEAVFDKRLAGSVHEVGQAFRGMDPPRLLPLFGCGLVDSCDQIQLLDDDDFVRVVHLVNNHGYKIRQPFPTEREPRGQRSPHLRDGVAHSQSHLILQVVDGEAQQPSAGQNEVEIGERQETEGQRVPFFGSGAEYGCVAGEVSEREERWPDLHPVVFHAIQHEIGWLGGDLAMGFHEAGGVDEAVPSLADGAQCEQARDREVRQNQVHQGLRHRPPQRPTHLHRSYRRCRSWHPPPQLTHTHTLSLTLMR